MYRYFDSIKNLQVIPLSYVIRKDLPVEKVMTTLTREEKIIHNSNTTVYIFSRDLATVLNILKECTQDTDADTWINNIWCGMLAMQALQYNYDGPSEERSRVTTAIIQLDKKYRHEYTFSFEKCVTALNGIFKTL